MLKNQVKAIFCRNEVELDIELQSNIIMHDSSVKLDGVSKLVHFVRNFFISRRSSHGAKGAAG